MLNISENKLKAMVIIPCFNEELNLQDTCASLGFGLVNNAAPGKHNIGYSK